jgi:hypothetical protein
VTYNPSDAHILRQICALCRQARPAGLLTMQADQWAAPIEVTNGKRDTICACEPCAREVKRLGGRRMVWRPFPTTQAPN